MAKFNPDQFKEAMEKAPKRLFTEITTRLEKRARAFLQGDLVKERLSGRPGLIRRSGALAGSFHKATKGDTLATWEMVEFTTSKYAALQEHGGTLRAKSKRFLTIPLDAAKAKSGDTRASARNWPDTFVQKNDKGNLLIYQDRGAKRKPLPLFLLTPSVRIPKRLGFFDAWTRNQEKRKEDIAKGVDAALDGLGA